MKATFEISGMGCEHCVNAVRGALENIEAVTVEEVEIGSATISYDSDNPIRDAVVDAIEAEGFEVIDGDR